ncbi:MAG: hypothetical protein ABF586_00405 [Sporolactobacillus sp.]
MGPLILALVILNILVNPLVDEAALAAWHPIGLAYVLFIMDLYLVNWFYTYGSGGHSTASGTHCLL